MGEAQVHTVSDTSSADTVTRNTVGGISFTAKLLLIIGFFVTIITCSSLFVFGTTYLIKKEIASLRGQDMKFATVAQDAESRFLSMDAAFNAWVGMASAGIQDSQTAQTMIQRVDSDELRFENDLSQLAGMSSAQEGRAIAKTKRDFQAYKDMINSLQSEAPRFAAQQKYEDQANLPSNILDDIRSLKSLADQRMLSDTGMAMRWGGILNLVVGIGGAGFIVFSIVLLLYIRGLLRPFRAMIDSVRRVAKGDLTVEPLRVRNRDEIGELARNFNGMTDHFRTVIEQAQIAAQEVAAVSEELNASADETSKAAERVARTISEATTGAQVQLQSAQNSVQGIETMLHDLERISRIISGVNEVAVSVRDEAERGNGIMEHAGAQMKVIQASVSTSHQLVEALNDSSRKIGAIADLIREIAEQTSLLSLNAAIEASRAGETGKGFIVVADEIRKLAEQSHASTQEIDDLIRTMRHSMEETVKATSAIASDVASGAEAVEKAEAAFAEIYRATVQMAEQLRDNTAIVQELAANSKNISGLVVQTSEIASESASLFQEVAAAAEEQLAAMNEILATSSSLNKLAAQLQGTIRHFRIREERWNDSEPERG